MRNMLVLILLFKCFEQIKNRINIGGKIIQYDCEFNGKACPKCGYICYIVNND